MMNHIKHFSFFKNLLIIMIGVLLFHSMFPATKVLASVLNGNTKEMNVVFEHSTEIEQAFEKIIAYSTYDYEKKHWVLSYDIVTDGHFTESQFQEAEKSGALWKNVEDTHLSTAGAQGRILPALLILAIKAVGVIVGTVIVTKMTEYFLTWGISSGCKKYKQYYAIKSFCAANGF